MSYHRRWAVKCKICQRKSCKHSHIKVINKNSYSIVYSLAKYSIDRYRTMTFWVGNRIWDYPSKKKVVIRNCHRVWCHMQWQFVWQYWIRPLIYPLISSRVPIYWCLWAVSLLMVRIRSFSLIRVEWLSRFVVWLFAPNDQYSMLVELRYNKFDVWVNDVILWV